MRKGLIVNGVCGPVTVPCRGCKTDINVQSSDAGAAGFVIPVTCDCGAVTVVATAPLVSTGATAEEAGFILAKAFTRATGADGVALWVNGEKDPIFFHSGCP